MPKTAWGDAHVVEEAIVTQTANGKEFAARVELLEDADGEELIRFSYSTSSGEAARRGPVTLRSADLRRLKKALAKTPRLRSAFMLR